MDWRKWAAAVVVLAGLGSAPAQGQSLYAASVRSIAGGVSGAVAGSLYTVNLASGAFSFVAPVRLNNATPLGLTGLAVHPQTGVFYGITSVLSSAHPQSLVTIDPATGNATLVGELRYEGSDIAFNRAGILFIWLPASSQLGLVNTSNGTVTPIGSSRGAGSPAGLAIDAHNVAYITPKGASGTLDVVDMATGVVTTGAPLTSAPYPSVVNSMTFSPSGLLLAVNSNAGSPASTKLVTINTATGVVSPIGALPDDTDALAFAADARRESLSTANVQTLALLVLGAIALILGLIGWFVGRKSHH